MDLGPNCENLQHLSALPFTFRSTTIRRTNQHGLLPCSRRRTRARLRLPERRERGARVPFTGVARGNETPLRRGAPRRQRGGLARSPPRCGAILVCGAGLRSIEVAFPAPMMDVRDRESGPRGGMSREFRRGRGRRGRCEIYMLYCTSDVFSPAPGAGVGIDECQGQREYRRPPQIPACANIPRPRSCAAPPSASLFSSSRRSIHGNTSSNGP